MREPHCFGGLIRLGERREQGPYIQTPETERLGSNRVHLGAWWEMRRWAAAVSPVAEPGWTGGEGRRGTSDLVEVETQDFVPGCLWRARRGSRSRSYWGVYPGAWEADALQMGVWEEGLHKAFRS